MCAAPFRQLSCSFPSTILLFSLNYPALFPQLSCPFLTTILPFYRNYPSLFPQLSCPFPATILPFSCNYPSLFPQLSCPFLPTILAHSHHTVFSYPPPPPLLTLSWRRMRPLPKSVMRICMDPLSRMFSGFKSRWTIPVQ